LELLVGKRLQTLGNKRWLSAELQLRANPTRPKEKASKEIVKVPVRVVHRTEVTETEPSRTQRTETLDTLSPQAEVEIGGWRRWEDETKSTNPDARDIAGEEQSSRRIEVRVVV